MAAKKKNAKLTFMSFKPLRGKKNCFVNVEAEKLLEKKTIVSRYMPYARFLQSVRSRQLVFISPEMWTDPFEKIYLESNISNGETSISFTSKQVACLCFTKHRFGNSDAFWKTFKTNVSQQLVRVEFNIMNVIEQICSLLKGMNVNVYVSVMNYRLNCNEIKNPKKFIPKIEENVDNTTDLEKLYVKMLSYKRMAFAYEKEIRIFIVAKNDICKENLFSLKKMAYEKAIEKIWLEPLPSDWVSPKKAKEELEDVSKILSDKIGRSSLFKKCDSCGEINLLNIFDSQTEKL